MRHQAVIDVQRADTIDSALCVLEELETVLGGVRACLKSASPGFPVYLNDVHHCAVALMLLSARHSTLLNVEQKMGAK